MSPLSGDILSPQKTAVALLLPAGFWWRALAWLLDTLVIAAAQFLLVALLFSVDGGFVGGALGLVLNWLYYAFMESSRWQATIGKKACALIVTTEAYEPVSFARATGRHFAKYLSILTLGVGYMMAAFTRRKQALHDILAGTLVLRVK